MAQTLPPVVRVFISSTFADMMNERNYFNQVLAPQLTRLCEKRGVSFFSVDLRWGITQEEQINGEVLPICLREIDKCRPFFIGILGNRYGSTLEKVTEELVAGFPWLANCEGKSITELEMLYGVLHKSDEKQHADCAFFFRDDALSKEYYDVPEQEGGSRKLTELKEEIKARADVPHYEYRTLEEFGTQLLADFEKWLDKEFPTVTTVKLARREWYNNELKRDYYEIPSMEQFLSNYLKNSNRSLLLYGEGQRGKTALLSNWAAKQENVILINCNADEEFRYWPAIAHEIIKRTVRIDATCGMPSYKAKETMMYKMQSRMRGENPEESGIYYVTDEERNSFRKGFVRWLQTLVISQPVTIIINDIQAIHDKSSYYLSWLPVSLPANVHLICTANADEIRENASNIGWNCMEMPLLEETYVKDFLNTYMHNYGKNLSTSQKEKLCASRLLQYPGYLKFIMKFLVVYGSFENLDYLTEKLGGMPDISKVYQFVLEYITSELEEKTVVYYALGFAYDTEIGLKEEECYHLVEQMIPVNALIWSEVRVVLEQFGAVSGEYWKLENADMEQLVQSFPVDRTQVNVLLGRHFMKLLQAGDKEESLKGIRQGTEYAKAAIEQYKRAADYSSLAQILQSDEVLFYLARVDWMRVRVAWMQMVLHSDIDVESVLVALAQKVAETDKMTAFKIACMLFDLEMYGSMPILQALLDKKIYSEMRFRSAGRFSEEFISRYNHIVTLKHNRDYRAVYHETRRWMEEGAGLSEEEQCEIYSLKEESEMILRLYAEAIETSGKAYALAVRTMDMENLMAALIARSNCQMHFNNREEAKKNFAYIKKLASEEGFLREYLSARNMEGMCHYREEKYDEAIATFDECIRIWQQVGNQHELQNCSVNRLTVFHLQGQKERFLEESKKLYEAIVNQNNPEYERNRLIVLNNIGLAEADLNHTEEAIGYFTEIIESCRAHGYDYALESACYNLMRIYKEQNLKVKGTEICEVLLEYLFSTRRFGELVSVLHDEIDQLQLFKYDTYAEELYRKWEARFETLPNGKALFENQGSRLTDEVRMTQIKEEMAVAQSADDKMRQGILLQEKAKRLTDLQVKESTDTYLEAAVCFEETGEKEQCHACAISAIENIFLREKNYEESRRAVFYPYLTEADREIISYWLAADQLREEAIADIEANEEKRSEFNGILVKVSEFKETSELVYPCLYDFFKELIMTAEESEVAAIVENVKNLSCYDTMINDIRATYEEEFGEGLHRLMSDFAGRNAERLLTLYERCVDFFLHVHKESAAMIAGNLALVFRRREEMEETFYYHNLSRDLYQELGKKRDSFIEAMNLATAYRDFKQMDKAVEILRETLKELKDSEYPDLEGGVAGNLASYLTRLNENGKYDEEIIACFTIEEAYFKNAGEQRGYAISLCNQIIFYLNNGEKYLEQLIAKYQEAKLIIEKYRIREFMQPLQQMGTSIEAVLRKKESGQVSGEATDANEVMAQVKAFFAEDEKFEIAEMRVRNGVLEVGGRLKEMATGAKTGLIINIQLHNPWVWDVVFLMQPQLFLNPNYDRDIYQYVYWWNLKEEYGLRMSDNHMLYIRKNYNLQAFEEARKEFTRDAKLWMADLMNMMTLALGAMDMDDVRDKKMKLLEEQGKSDS